jgi:predicted transposase YbfD/YdcC
VKGNQKGLLQEIKEVFSLLEEMNPHSWSVDEGHGRRDYRALWVRNTPLSLKPFWKGIKQVWKYRTIREESGKKTEEIIYGITDLSDTMITPKELLQRIRKYWTVENPCHQVLDVTFEEDYCRTRDSKSRQNLALLRRFALTILQNVPGRTIPDKRRYLNDHQDFMLKMLGIPFQKGISRE